MNTRRHERFNAGIIDINGDVMFAKEVNILNISIGGMSLKADRRLNIGMEYTIKMRVKDSVISAKGKVVWSLLSEARSDHKGNSIPFYTVGIKFTNGSNKEIEELIRFIKRHGKASEGNDDSHSAKFEVAQKPETDEELLQLFANQVE